MGITTYCATCGKRSSMMLYRPSGWYYLYTSCICPPSVTDPYYWPQQFKPRRSTSLQELAARVKAHSEQVYRELCEEKQ